MTQWRFEVFSKPGFADVHGAKILEQIHQVGIHSVEAVQSAKVYLVQGDLDAEFAKRLAKELFADPVCEECYIGRTSPPPGLARATLVEVHLKSGVTDPVAQSVMTAIQDMGGRASLVRTARKYLILGQINQKALQTIIRSVLANDCIEICLVGQEAEPPVPHVEPYRLQIVRWPILGLGPDQLLQLSKEKDLFLNLIEMQAIQRYYQGLGREPTDIEIETIAQTWSEHCVHKTLRSPVDLESDGRTISYENLLKDTIFKATAELNKPWCISVFSDNAGVVEFDDELAICFKVETHNHPSALDPYGGAATGIGGVIRDPMGTGLGARPVANTDVFCFGPPDIPHQDLPKGVLHPKRIMAGVVAGVRDYGNRMGIPTVNGAIYFDRRYIGNPIVYCGTIGVLEKTKTTKQARPGHLIVLVGGRTGRDGIHGATFSSGQMTHQHEQIFSHAVQIGNAITEKKMLDVLMQAKQEGLYQAITDCGAGGLSSAVGEMGAHLGAEVDLDLVPLKYAGLSYTEIWISEAQERMVLAVEPGMWERLKRLCDSEDVEATVIGHFTSDKKLTLRYQGQQVGQLDMDFLHRGLPMYRRKAVWQGPRLQEPALPQQQDYTADLMGILSCYNVASKEWVIRQYDHEVQAGSVVKPLTGLANDGPSDAAVIRPRLDSNRAVAVACGMNPMYGDIDPYWMAVSAIDEAIRNLICVGARFDRIALLDNFCWADCSRPEVLGSLVRAAQGCYDGAIAFGTPFISGKDSLNNEFVCEDGSIIAIPPTLLMSGISIVDDASRCLTMDLKAVGNYLFLVGLTDNELGGSHYYKIKGHLGANVPKVDLKTAPRIAAAMAGAIADGLVESCHDCSEGGLGVAIAEMAFAGGLGVDVDLRGVPACSDRLRPDVLLFSESNTRFVVEVSPDRFDAFARRMLNLPFGLIGRVVGGRRMIVRDGKDILIDADIDALRQAWKRPLAWD